MGTCAACAAAVPEGARFCLACGAPVEAPLAEERKLVTVLFADLVGSTALADAEDPEQTRAVLSRFYDAMTDEIERAGGTVEKFAGDAVMAAFGAPVAHEDDAERALHAALAMQRRLQELFGDRLALRIGVNTGQVVVGRPRAGSSFVTGDAVNVAARLEQVADAGEILVGERTVAAAEGAFEFGEPTTVEAKGKPGGVRCRRVVRALSLMRPRGVRGLGRAFVGRRREFDALREAFRSACEDGEPHLVTVVGEAGVGKTRLVRELWEWLASEAPQAHRRTGRCLSYGDGITYWPLGEVLKEHLGILDSDSPTAVLDRLRGREILALTLGLDVVGDLHPLAARDRLHEGWIHFIEELAAETPTVLLIEDLHWGEEPLLELLERLVRDARGPIVLVATGRPELLDRRPGWGGRSAAQLLRLEALTPEEATEMLRELFRTELPEKVRDVVVQHSEGNPFFVEEVVSTLIDRGLLRRENGSWATAELPRDFLLPDSVQAVLAARIDLLEPPEKAALQAAAVIGRIFWSGPVYELVQGAEPDLRVLEERDFIWRRSGSSLLGDREYAIKHALTREIAYESLPRARRAQLHAAFAEWLERTGEGRDEHASLLAHHYAAAVRPEDVELAWPRQEEEVRRLREKARSWLRRAAELALSRYEIDDGLALLHRAVELDPEWAHDAGLWWEIGHANALKYDGDAFWEAMHKSLALAETQSARADSYAELAFQTVMRAGMWKTSPDRELVQGWIDSALELADHDSAARVKALLANVLWSGWRSVDQAAEASALAERLGDAELRAHAWLARATTALARARYDDALSWAQRPAEMLPEINDPDTVAEIHFAPVPASVALGRFREARRLAARYDETLRRLTPHHRLHGVAIVLEVEELAGSWQRVIELEPRVEEDVEANLATPCVRNPRSLLLCALARAYLGDEERAAQLEQAAEALGMTGYPVVLDPPRARLALLRGDLETLEAVLPDPKVGRWGWLGVAARTARLDGLAALGKRDQVEAEATPLLGPNTYFEPFALRALGVVRKDEQLIADAAARFEAMKLDWHAAQTRTLSVP
ncbi:MAG: adenylate/guanylate cyclase domain-containing protein [Gaiellaceae bacterium]